MLRRFTPKKSLRKWRSSLYRPTQWRLGWQKAPNSWYSQTKDWSEPQSICHQMNMVCVPFEWQRPSSQVTHTSTTQDEQIERLVSKTQEREMQVYSRRAFIFKVRILEKKIYSCFPDTLKHLTVWETSSIVYHSKLCKILKKMGIQDHFTCLLRNLYVGKEARVRDRQWAD